MGENAADRLEDLRFVLPGPDHHRQRGALALTHHDELVIRQLIKPGRWRNNVVQVVVTAGESPRRPGVRNQLTERLAGRPPRERGSGPGWTTHGHS